MFALPERRTQTLRFSATAWRFGESAWELLNLYCVSIRNAKARTAEKTKACQFESLS